MEVVRIRMTIRGVVQGVGFRPHVHRLAGQRSLAGFVGNDSASVFVEIEGHLDDVAWFRDAVIGDAPPLARIDSVAWEERPTTGTAGFEIVASRSAPGSRTFVSPDVAVCDDCLAELFDPGDRRYRYPFITCTNCGPRFTIVRQLPYDRPNTTMAGFPLCEACRDQYEDPTDRRFHAQPLACSACGPHLTHLAAGRATVGDDTVIAAVQRGLGAGQVIAIKGLGGYHLACNALDGDAVDVLRARKGRVDKPFAVMVADVDAARRVAALSDAEVAALVSPARPIVLARTVEGVVSPQVAPRNPLIGVMLPYTPLHHLLFHRTPGSVAPVPEVLVMTSGNLTDEPLAYDDDDARRRLGHLVDAFCIHDRPIHVPCDDSVVRIVDGREMPIRRSRGYAPMPIRLPTPVAPTLAVGAQLKNTFCIAEGHDAWMSQHIGDMGNLETLSAFERSVAQFGAMYSIEPTIVAADAHPDYATRRWADTRHGGSVAVQHHHAHVVALMAEHGLDGSEPIVGVAFDGTGYGLDGAIWGGEILVVDGDHAQRFASLAEVPLPGGDAAIRKPYRIALAHLWSAGVEWDDQLAPVAHCSERERRALASMLRSGTGCVPTTSIGRLFDAIASIVGVRHEISYEGQAAIELEHLAAGVDADRPLPLRLDGATIDAGPLIVELVRRRRDGEQVSSLAAAFHDAVADVIVDAAVAVRRELGITTVGLTGGVFQNARLVTTARHRLEQAGCSVLTHRLVPANDGGLALGQVLIAGRCRPARVPPVEP